MMQWGPWSLVCSRQDTLTFSFTFVRFQIWLCCTRLTATFLLFRMIVVKFQDVYPPLSSDHLCGLASLHGSREKRMLAMEDRSFVGLFAPFSSNKHFSVKDWAHGFGLLHWGICGCGAKRWGLMGIRLNKPIKTWKVVDSWCGSIRHLFLETRGFRVSGLCVFMCTCACACVCVCAANESIVMRAGWFLLPI